MKEKIIIATGNSHKLDEFRRMLGTRFEVLGMRDIGCDDHIPEDGESFEENAAAKALWISRRYGVACLADDSGLEVDALGGEPGVFSARYAGDAHDDKANNRLLLEKLGNNPNRRARFRTVLAWARPGKGTMLFSGSVEGEILAAPAGEEGFGYDPLFRPLGWNRTFGQASPVQKNAVSHRSRALENFLRYYDN